MSERKRIDKSDLVRELCAAIAEKERLTAQQADAAHRAATHEESVPENDKDTRALEASYLAGAQAARARELKAIQNRLSFVPLHAFGENSEIGLTAIVTLQSGAKQTLYFLMPYGGGVKLRADAVTVVTPEAALGQAILGLTLGESFVVGGREYEVVAIA